MPRFKGRRRNLKSRDGEKNYALVAKTNESFEHYYKTLGIVPEGEWDSFMEALRRPLPATFRVTGFRRQARQLLHIIKSEYFDDLFNIEVDGRTVNPPKCLPWYPQELAWQLDLDRKSIRHSEPLKKLHTFLVQETESGNLSRQEAVSMIPPLVLDVQSHHKVLDMCAAPGSKTAQLLEMLHAEDTTAVPAGCVVANDSDNKRCYLMTHQVKRLETPSFMIINQDATCLPSFKLPNEEGHMKSVKFDRILADVPCSGDGTLRKNIDAWAKWNTHMGMNLHNIQSRILNRGLELLDVGGRLVYSTCSLNPIEDEAVICNLLRKCKGAVRLVDVSDKLPGLKWVPGVSSWKVMSREHQLFDNVESIPDRLQSTIRPSVFPPSPEECESFQLYKCIRILPHHQDTGGFFIGVLEKTEEVPWVKHVWFPPTEAQLQAAKNSAQNNGANSDEPSLPKDTEGGSTEQTVNSVNDEQAKETVADGSTSETQGKRPREQRAGSPQQRKRRQFGYKEDPFIFIDDTDPIWPPVKEFYGLEKFPVEQLLVRCTEGKKRNIYFTSPIIKSLVTHNVDRIKIINLGLKILSRSDSQYVSCPFRTVQDGMLVLFPHVSKRIVDMTKEDVITLLSTEMPFLSRFSQTCQDQLSVLTQGSVIFVYDPVNEDGSDSPQCRMVLCGWLGKTSCRSFIPVNDRGHYLRMCGAELQLYPKVTTVSDLEKDGGGQEGGSKVADQNEEALDQIERDLDSGDDKMEEGNDGTSQASSADDVTDSNVTDVMMEDTERNESDIVLTDSTMAVAHSTTAVAQSSKNPGDTTG